MYYQEKYGLLDDDIRFIDENIQKANVIFSKIEKKQNPIKENCESAAIEKYLDSL